MTEVQVDFARRLKALLASKGITTSAKAATALGVSRSYMLALWNGDRTPQIDTAEKFLAKIGSGLVELYRLELPEEPPSSD